MTDKTTIIQQIASTFSLSEEAAQTACLLLEARAKTLDFTFDEYIQRYHPDGIAERDDKLPEQLQGYVEFLKDDAAAVLHAGKGADFSTFVHECAHVFRRQLTGELREQADKAFGVTDGSWSREKDELFAKGLEQWLKHRRSRDKTRENVYNKGKGFVDTVYRGMERIVEIDSRMEAVYERLFEDTKYTFNQDKYVDTLHSIAEGKLPEKSHVFLGMTPRIYEELGFQRLPMAITGKHLFSTFHETGTLDHVHYHNLGEDLLRQIPEQLKKPVCIVQSPNDPTEIISILGLKDTKGDTIVIPVAQYMKGNYNGTEIDINLIKTVFGQKGFEYWLTEAIEDDRLLYIDKKKTEPDLLGGWRKNPQTISTLPDPFPPPPDQIDDHPTTDVFGFAALNIARYREAVKQKYPERFIPQGERILYKTSETQQLSLDFTETNIPYPNIPENFTRNFRAIAEEFKNDTVEAARFLLRAMSKENRETALLEMRNAGCTDKESYHTYLLDILSPTQSELKQKYEETTAESKPDDQSDRISLQELNEGWKEGVYTIQDIADNIKDGENFQGWPADIWREAAALVNAYNAEKISGTEFQKKQDILFSEAHKVKSEADKPQNFRDEYQPFGAWTDFNMRLSVQQREQYNKEALAVLDKAAEGPITEDETDILRRYSGFGGISADGERGVLYDFYTSPPVARMVWNLLEKSGGIADVAKILEPSCGTGVFFEYAPRNKMLSFTGVELDERTAQVAQQLHRNKNAEILHMSFEAFNLSDKAGGFDHIIGNVPFGERTAALAALDMPDEKSLDNYFITRCIDNLAADGTMALITAAGVLENKTNEDFRLSINKKAQFIGAVKLPNRSFHHTHTQVTPDILLFRKYPDDIVKRLAGIDDNSFKASPLYDVDFVNGNYFRKHPEHIAGTVSTGSGQWGNDEIKGDITPERIGHILSTFTQTNHDLPKAFSQIRSMLPIPYTADGTAYLQLTHDELQQLEAQTLRHGAVKIYEKQVYILTEQNQYRMVSTNVPLAHKLQRIKAITGTVRAIQDGMKAEKDTQTIQAIQKKCRQQLLDYQRTYNSFPADDTDIKRFTRGNPAVHGVYEAFLSIDDPLLSSANVYRTHVDLVDGHNTAVTALLTLQKQLTDGTEENIRAVFPDTADSLIREMRNHADVFITPDGCYQLREDFISGDVWEKIDALKESAQHETIEWKKELLLHGADELETAVGWTQIEDADCSPRSSWIPLEIIREWAAGDEALGINYLTALAKNDEGKWGTGDGEDWHEMNDSLVYYLNGQKQRSRTIDTDTYNKEHDDLFRSFISNHETYRARLESEYNRKFKTHIIAPVKTYPIEIAGWRNAEHGGKTLKPHQWQSVHHLYRQQRGISALGTGFGKTVTAIALMSLLRQEGKAKRLFLQVPNNKVKDWIEEIHDVMPDLQIASIDPEEPGYVNRDKRYAKYQAMARSDADIIIMPESAASEIQLSPAHDDEVTKRVSFRYKMEQAGSSARQQERAAQRGEYKAQSGKTNITVCFEDFGCDTLIVDEAHRYKNLFSSTLSRETGLNDGRQSAKAMSLYKKSEYIRGQNDGKNVFLLTATPLTNSPLEYYNMMQYVAPQELRRMGVHTIDGFIHEFANIELGWLYDWGNGQAKQGRILTGFKNLSTLQNLFFTYTDLQNNPDAVGIEKPLAENQPHIIGVDTQQSAVIKSISEELARYKAMDADERKDEFPGQNFLTFYSQMRTASLDLQLYDPVTYKNWKNPKLQALAENAYTNYQETNGGQVIFCDRVFSSDGSFNMHERIKDELITQGFKAKDIVIVNGFTKSGGLKSDSAIEKEVSKAIADYNAGKYTAIIGSTACIGEGVNLQKNSSAVHHFDIPYRPSDFIQRNGRVDRQGNEQNTVGLHTYLAAGTIDNYSVNLVQRKANWIDQMLRTKSAVFTNPNDENSIDADELLLALTEEWGDKEAVLKRREAMERQKNEKIREAQTKQMNTYVKNLSLSRGALQPLIHKEHTKEYKKLAGQIANIETALKNNPVFCRHDILGNHEPFLYNGDSGNIFRTGDVIITKHGRYMVEGFHFKKQLVMCTELLSDEEIREKKIQYRSYGGGYNPRQDFKVSELKPEGNRYHYNSFIGHIEKASPEDKEIIKSLSTTAYYNLMDETKEKWYDLHIKVNSDYGTGVKPMVFVMNKDGELEIKRAQRLSKDDTVLNPFNAGTQAVIIKGINAGIEYNEYEKEDIMSYMNDMLPAYAQPLYQIMGIPETQERAQDVEEAVENELITQAAVTLDADINHLKSHVHVVRAR